MAFNFNWSPLMADTSRAKEMLTAALNKSPKPPIIVDDIIVNELNLGSVPPELEILEIGDLAEDRFRGIFKMSYTGDAYLTLKTRVQANPLNTYLSTKPSFTSPQPLAASSGLTIPIQITLSDIRLSGFVILVFSRQKGITLVFRNDPLESLKVSSTFDSIPFVRNYLQKEIEAQLRVLFMDDLPAIIHRLSLRAFVPEYRNQEQDEQNRAAEDDSRPPIDPLASPPQNPVDFMGDGLDDRDASDFSLDQPTETYASFSQKNLLRLSVLTESQRTLSLFTPSIRDTVFRAWAGANEGGDHSGTNTPHTRPHLLSRIHSSIAGPSSWSSSASDVSDTPTHHSRPSVSSYTSTATVYTMGTNKSRAHAGKKRKHRVVDLRKNAPTDTSDSDYAESVSAPSITVTEPLRTPPLQESEPDAELQTPQRTPQRTPAYKVRFQSQFPDDPHSTPLKLGPRQPSSRSELLSSSAESASRSPATEEKRKPSRPKLPTTHLSRSASASRLPSFTDGSTGGILEQAWMMKMAQEIARKVREEKVAGAFWDPTDGMDHPPPAYAL